MGSDEGHGHCDVVGPTPMQGGDSREQQVLKINPKAQRPSAIRSGRFWGVIVLSGGAYVLAGVALRRFASPIKVKHGQIVLGALFAVSTTNLFFYAEQALETRENNKDPNLSCLQFAASKLTKVYGEDLRGSFRTPHKIHLKLKEYVRYLPEEERVLLVDHKSCVLRYFSYLPRAWIHMQVGKTLKESEISLHDTQVCIEYLSACATNGTLYMGVTQHLWTIYLGSLAFIVLARRPGVIRWSSHTGVGCLFLSMFFGPYQGYKNTQLLLQLVDRQRVGRAIKRTLKFDDKGDLLMYKYKFS